MQPRGFTQTSYFLLEKKIDFLWHHSLTDSKALIKLFFLYNSISLLIFSVRSRKHMQAHIVYTCAINNFVAEVFDWFEEGANLHSLTNK